MHRLGSSSSKHRASHALTGFDKYYVSSHHPDPRLASCFARKCFGKAVPFLLCESAENGRVFRSSFSFACAGWREASRVGRVSVGRDAWAQQPNLAHRIILEAPRTPTPPEPRARPRLPRPAHAHAHAPCLVRKPRPGRSESTPQSARDDDSTTRRARCRAF